jgi:hypothetical protein
MESVIESPRYWCFQNPLDYPVPGAGIEEPLLTTMAAANNTMARYSQTYPRRTTASNNDHALATTELSPAKTGPAHDARVRIQFIELATSRIARCGAWDWKAVDVANVPPQLSWQLRLAAFVATSLLTSGSCLHRHTDSRYVANNHLCKRIA